MSIIIAILVIVYWYAYCYNFYRVTAQRRINMKKLGVIGFGGRLHGDVIQALCDVSDEFKVTAIADPATDKVRERIEKKPRGIAENVELYDDADKLLAEADVDAILIGTRCSLHTTMAIKAMERNVPIFLEKPVCTSMEDLQRLNDANKKYNPRVLVSFPLRFSAITVLVKEILDSGKIGEILQVDAYNDVPYGRVYYQNWHRDENETGGLWLQKATHDFDYLNYLLNDKATEVFARDVRKLFKGDMPAGMTCDKCDKTKTCPESPYIVRNKYLDYRKGPYCCFAVDTGNEDCGTALMKRESGAIVSYSQNFFARHNAARRGARFYGYNGTLEFDWYKGEIKVYMHTSPHVETYALKDSGTAHFGGDQKLAEMFLDIMNGTNVSYLNEGMESALQCLMAKQSCETGSNIIIPEL